MQKMIRLNVNTDIYSTDNILKAVDAYRNLAKIQISRKRQIIKIVFWNCKYDEEITVREFENYLIGLENL